MGTFTRFLLCLCAALIAFESPLIAGGSGSRVAYVGGTVPHVRNNTEGVVLMTDDQSFLFFAKGIRMEVPYEKINLLEYGQKAGRRFAMAIVISPMFLLSKARKHYLTIGYADEEGRQQAIVFQVDKRHVRAVLAGLEAKTGLKVQYQDDEARKNGKG